MNTKNILVTAYLIFLYLIFGAIIIRMMIVGKGILHPDFDRINKSAKGIFKTYFNWNSIYGKFIYYFMLMWWFLSLLIIICIVIN